MADPVPLAPKFVTSPDAGIDTTGYSNFQVGNNSTSQFLLGNNGNIDASLASKILSPVDQGKDNGVTTPFQNYYQSAIDSTLFQDTIRVNQSQKSGTVTPNSLEGRPNPLNKYTNYTYHIRFSMADETSAYSGDVINGKTLNKRIIAESGRTVGFNITKFSFTNTVSPGFKHQNMNVMNWRMTITEPFGLTFSDAMQAAAKELYINNHSRFPLFLELWFNGYDEDGNFQPQIEGIYKIWRVMILNCSLQTTQSGTVYELEGTTDNDLCNTNQLSMTKSMLNLKGVTKLKDLTTKLEEQLNADAKKAENKSSIKYIINLPDEMKEWDLKAIDFNTQVNSLSEANGLTVPIARGQDIGAFLASAISKCQKADDFLTGTGSGSNVNRARIESHGLARFIQIIPQMKMGAYDPLFKDYYREVTFNIIPFYTPRCVTDPKQADKLKDITIQENKFAFWKENGMLAKKYEYIYTGKNTEILKFDINIENLWQIIVPGYLGARSYHEFAVGPQVAPNTVGIAENNRYLTLNKVFADIAAKAAINLDIISKITGGVANEYSNFANNFNGALGGFNTAVNSVNGALENVSYSVDTLTKTLGLGTNLSFSNNLIPTFDLGTITNFDQLKQKAFNLVNLDQGRTAENAIILPARFIEEIEKVTLKIDEPDPLQVAFYTDNNPSQQNATINGNNTKTKVSQNIKVGGFPVGQGLFGALMANMYDPTYFLSITLDIRGDPWWIGMTNLETNQYIVGKKSNDSVVSGGYADYLQGENLFLLTFQTGTNYDEETGLMKLEGGSQYYNGLYSVLEVENRFEGGNFTQTLTAYKEMFSQTIDKLLTPTVSSTNAGANNTPNIPGIIQQQNPQAQNNLTSTNLINQPNTSLA